MDVIKPITSTGVTGNLKYRYHQSKILQFKYGMVYFIVLAVRASIKL